MSDDRSLGARLARIEALFARVEQRVNDIVEERKDWKIEVGRRLDSNNANAEKLMEERARDRAELVTLDLYNSRHSELKSQMESFWRELIQKIESLSARVDQKLEQHERDVAVERKTQQDQIEELKSWVSNQKGRQLMIAVGLTLFSGMVGVIVQVIFHVFSGK